MFHSTHNRVILRIKSTKISWLVQNNHVADNKTKHNYKLQQHKKAKQICKKTSNIGTIGLDCAVFNVPSNTV